MQQLLGLGEVKTPVGNSTLPPADTNGTDGTHETYATD
jgi:hypothetical protein